MVVDFGEHAFISRLFIVAYIIGVIVFLALGVWEFS